MTFPNKQGGERKKASDSGRGGQPTPEATPEAHPKSAPPLYARDQPVPSLGLGAAGEGRPLDDDLRRPLEQFLERPLDRVRVFSGPESREAADSHGAYALTHGQNIHLGARAEGLSGEAGRGLLAHEAAHTAQQGEAAAPSVQLSSLTPDAEDSPQERQAEGLAHAFTAHERGDSAGLALRDSIGLRPHASNGLQLARHPTHFGEFEDYKFRDITKAGTQVGVHMHLKFHPGSNVDAKKIGLTQAAETSVAGGPGGSLLARERSATTGAGRGYHIDMPEEFPSPMYAADKNEQPGSDPTKIGSYNAPGVRPMTPSERADVKRLGVSGLPPVIGAAYGYRYRQGGRLKGPRPAELVDNPMEFSSSRDSEQKFETAAFAFEGTMAGTYLGSVEWGWRRDATGSFARIPVATKSQGVPSADFLTAANLWNTSKVDFQVVTISSPTRILTFSLRLAFNVPRNTPLSARATGTGSDGRTYYMVMVGPSNGPWLVLDTDVRPPVMAGRETVDLPVPEIYTVNAASGATLESPAGRTSTDPTLPRGTRVRLVGPHTRTPGYVSVEVADGPLTGRSGVLRQTDLTREELGTR